MDSETPEAAGASEGKAGRPRSKQGAGGGGGDGGGTDGCGPQAPIRRVAAASRKGTKTATAGTAAIPSLASTGTSTRAGTTIVTTAAATTAPALTAASTGPAATSASKRALPKPWQRGVVLPTPQPQPQSEAEVLGARGALEMPEMPGALGPPLAQTDENAATATGIPGVATGVAATVTVAASAASTFEASSGVSVLSDVGDPGAAKAPFAVAVSGDAALFLTPPSLAGPRAPRRDEPPLPDPPVGPVVGPPLEPPAMNLGGVLASSSPRGPFSLRLPPGTDGECFKPTASPQTKN